MRLLMALAVVVGTVGCAQAADYPSAPPLAQYRMDPAEEIAMARSAAPPAISGQAEILVLGARGYETAIKGTSGFVCLVQRGWANDFDAPEFWSPKVRGPICFNPPAARTVVPSYLKRTEWVLAGSDELRNRSGYQQAFASSVLLGSEVRSDA